MDLTTVPAVIALLESSTTSEEWHENCIEIRAANGGRYPRFWFRQIMLSGIPERICAQWGGDIEVYTTSWEPGEPYP